MAVLPQRRHLAFRAAADAAGRQLSSDDVQIVRAAYEALASDGPEGMIAYIHQDFHGVVTPDLSAEPDSYDGHEGVRRYFRLFAETVEDLEFVVHDVFDDGDRVLAEFTMCGKGRGSGIPVDMRLASAIKLRDGKFIEMTSYRDMDEARASR